MSFSGSYFYQARTIDNGIPAYSYTGSINFPIWTSGRIHAEIGKADFEEQRLREERSEIETSIRQQVKTALEVLQAARNAVQVANEGYALAEQEVAQAQRRFAAGVATNIEVTSAQDALARASDNQIEALYRFNQSRADLARATGDAEAIYAK